MRMVSEDSGTPEEDFDEMIMTPSLTLLFSDRRDMQKEDTEVIRSLGLQFRGKNAWPLFRSQKPGYARWFLEAEEVFFLTAVIEQALVVSDRVKNKQLDLYEMADEDLVLTRYCDNGEWKEDWRPAPDLRSNAPETREASEVSTRGIELLRRSLPRVNSAWELDIFILPMPVGSKLKRPYFPLCFLAVDGQSGTVIDCRMEEPWIKLARKREVVIDILKKTGIIPRNIRVTSAAVKEILDPIAENLGINLKTGSIPALEFFKANLDEFLSRH